MEDYLDDFTLDKKAAVKWTFTDRIAHFIAAISFLLGTLIFATFAVSRESGIAIIGLYYLMIAFTVNMIMLLILLILCVVEKHQLKSHLRSIGILVINIPVAIIYFVLFTHMDNY
ncbi:MAG: hypothetical protein AAF487_14010 [Bacteroidota bacterium]